MTKVHLLFIIVVALLAIWGTEKALADTTTIFAPNGTVTVCTTGQNVVICV